MLSQYKEMELRKIKYYYDNYLKMNRDDTAIFLNGLNENENKLRQEIFYFNGQVKNQKLLEELFSQLNKS